MTLHALATATPATLAAALAAADTVEAEVANGKCPAEAAAAFRSEGFAPFLHLVGARPRSMSDLSIIASELA